MRKWIDSYQYSKVIDGTQEEIYSKLIGEFRNSVELKVVSKSEKTIRLESTLKEWFMTPSLPKYRVAINFFEEGKNSTKLEIKISGNFLVTFFKYLGILMFVGGIIIQIIDPFENEENNIGSIVPFLLGPLLWTIILNFRNRANIQKGYKKTSEIIRDK